MACQAIATHSSLKFRQHGLFNSLKFSQFGRFLFSEGGFKVFFKKSVIKWPDDGLMGMKRIKLMKFLPIAALAVFAGVRTSQAGSDLETVAAAKSNLSPSWSFKDINGTTIQSTDYKGKVVVVNFWATWCGPCRLEIPGFADLQKKYSDQGLQFIGASVDDGGIGVVAEAAKKLGINYPVGLATTEMLTQFQAGDLLPTTFILNRSGKVVWTHVGGVEEGDIESVLKPLLAEKAP